MEFKLDTYKMMVREWKVERFLTVDTVVGVQVMEGESLKESSKQSASKCLNLWIWKCYCAVDVHWNLTEIGRGGRIMEDFTELSS